MNSEGKLFAPKPIRKCATALPLKPYRSIGYPINSSKTHKNKKLNKCTENKIKNSNSDLASEISKKDNLILRSNIELEKKNYVSYQEFQSEIDNEFVKQSATLEILSILASNKRSFSSKENFNNFACNWNKIDNKHLEIDCSNAEFDNDYFFEEKKVKADNDEVKLFKNYKDEVERYSNDKNHNVNIDNENNYNNNLISNSILKKNEIKEENNLSKNYQIEINKKNNESKEISKLTEILDCLIKENEKDLESNILSNYNLIQNAQSETKIKKINVDNNVNKPCKEKTNESYDNLIKKKKKIIKENEHLNNNDSKNKEDLPFGKSQEKKNFYNEKTHNDNEAYKRSKDNLTNNASDILYFIDENFFLELQNENMNNYLTTSFKKEIINNSISNRRNELNHDEVYKESIPIRCKNPFLKSLKKEGLNKVNKFFNDEENIKKANNSLLFNLKEPIEKFLFSEKAKFQTKKMNIL